MRSTENSLLLSIGVVACSHGVVLEIREGVKIVIMWMGKSWDSQIPPVLVVDCVRESQEDYKSVLWIMLISPNSA